MNNSIFNQIVRDVASERVSQEHKHGTQNHLPDSTDNPTARETYEMMARNACNRAFREGRLTFAHILDEEVSEALTAAANRDVEALKKELVQCAAVCCQWLEALEERTMMDALTLFRYQPMAK